MKSLAVSDARQLLKNAGCTFTRSNKHEIWKDAIGRTFALASNHREISPGVARKIYKFVNGK